MEAVARQEHQRAGIAECRVRRERIVEEIRRERVDVEGAVIGALRYWRQTKLAALSLSPPT